ncbi:hypothetical protein V7S43_016667 [Phytophthora oleae]|uniref:Uncharacterized protein n=1 Tax=Phytophthora oleae TaxID=2107226 RepID=A0ABD3EUZ1_9STRA
MNKIVRSGGKRCNRRDSISLSLVMFSCHKKLKFDTLLPVFVPADNRDVDDFIEILPVREMFSSTSGLLHRGRYL